MICSTETRKPKTRAGCSEYQGRLEVSGYGRLWDGKRGFVYAHRKAWELAHGPIPEGMLVCHTCDNRACVNVDHLFLGTAKDNMDDMANKGRCPWGRRITPEEREVVLTSPLSARKLAKVFGVSRSQINKVRLGG